MVFTVAAVVWTVCCVRFDVVLPVWVVLVLFACWVLVAVLGVCLRR